MIYVFTGEREYWVKQITKAVCSISDGYKRYLDDTGLPDTITERVLNHIQEYKNEGQKDKDLHLLSQRQESVDIICELVSLGKLDAEEVKICYATEDEFGVVQPKDSGTIAADWPLGIFIRDSNLTAEAEFNT